MPLRILFYSIFILWMVKIVFPMFSQPNAVPQNLAISELDRQKVRSINIEVEDQGVSYVKVCSSAKIKKIEGGESTFNLIFRDHIQTSKEIYESTIFLHPHTLSDSESHLKIITENGHINLNVKVNTKQKNKVLIVGEPLVLEMDNISWLFKSSFDKTKIAIESNNEFQLNCNDALLPNQLDYDVKHFISEHEKKKDVENAIKLAELELKILIQQKKLELQEHKNRLHFLLHPLSFVR